jgi:general secretion pathway protein J
VRSRRGLTLIEVMVSIGILLVMSAAVVESLRNAITFQNLLGDRDELLRTARVAMERLGRDLQLAYLTPNLQAVERYQTVFVGTTDEPSQLYFASLNHQRTILDSRECDQTEITVWGEQAEKDRGTGYILYHREAPRIDQYPDEQGVIWPIAYNVRSFRVRYLDQATNEWKNEWDTRGVDTPYRLPRAVELGLILITPDPADPTGEATVDVPFLSRVIVEYGQPLPTAGAPFLPNAAGGYANVPVPIPGGIPPAGGLLGGMGGLMGGGVGNPYGTGMPAGSAGGPVRR